MALPAMIERARDVGYDDRDIATRLGVMVCTVRAWATKEMAPHRLMRGGYERQLHNLISEAARKQATGED